MCFDLPGSRLESLPADAEPRSLLLHEAGENLLRQQLHTHSAPISSSCDGHAPYCHSVTRPLATAVTKRVVNRPLMSVAMERDDVFIIMMEPVRYVELDGGINGQWASGNNPSLCL